MSSTPLDLPILISQLPFVQKIAHAEKAKPEINRLLFGPLIQAQLRQREGTVQQVQKKTATDPVDRDGHDNQRQEAASERKDRERDEDTPETGASDGSPWSGNIVNVKI
ncbi:hypothetical protein LF599_10480 [Pseudodesulfovibrio thermohalotolerans]|uniref:hypothetical protein n=1 Tax=Pseudodesulfovibrio thermohalotolerans TaxID=2880651 RepID=UPI002441934D|nr:hypothetical protein [Pseudodesulfovibrio thermohalotolerans]WFS61104.1 hypothetical protein LF599_10480 [Pseudodesulfovibrio thermohalotolerans]